MKTFEEEAITFERQQHEEETTTSEQQHDEEDTAIFEQRHEEEMCALLKNGKCADEFSMMRGKYPSEHFCHEVCGFYIKCK